MLGVDIYDERAFSRAWREFSEWLRTVTAWVWLVIVGALAAFAGTFLSPGHSRLTQASIAAGSALGGALIVAVWMLERYWITAPVRQRNEARVKVKNLKGEGANIDHDEAAAIAEAAIAQGEEYLGALHASPDRAATSRIYQQLNPWATETFYELRRYSELWAQPFAQGGFSGTLPHDAPEASRILEVKLEVLRGLIREGEMDQ